MDGEMEAIGLCETEYESTKERKEKNFGERSGRESERGDGENEDGQCKLKRGDTWKAEPCMQAVSR